ncbi:MAG: hypothetical protein FJZ86_18895 [Chloroflexi bacterium]|nr:hypothetical protein [Chloroflexota bacterium]
MKIELPLHNNDLFACIVNAIPPEEREPHFELTRRLFQASLRVVEIENGFTFLFSNQTDTLFKLFEFIRLERLCCPFLGFTVDIRPNSDQVWLSLTGEEGIKLFIKSEIDELGITSPQ